MPMPNHIKAVANVYPRKSKKPLSKPRHHVEKYPKMKEYTLLAVASVVLMVFLDRKSGINLLRRGEYYIFLFIILIFKFLVNGYLTSKDIVIYNPRFFLGLRLVSIPIEDFLFGFSMITLCLIVWEYFKDRLPVTRK